MEKTRIKSMTKQKFYEMVVIKTLKNSRYETRSPFYDLAESLEESDFDSFAKLMIKIDLLGKGDMVPSKQPFDRLGFDYVAQIFGFVMHNGNDNELCDGFFDLLKKYPKIIDWNSSEQVDFICRVYIDSVLDHEKFDFTFAYNTLSLIIQNIDSAVSSNKDSVISCLRVAHGLGVVGDCDDYFNIPSLIDKYCQS